MEEKYTLEQFIEELDNGFEFKFTYVKNKYLLFKTTENCYTQKLLSAHDKNPQPRMQMVTLTRVNEIFPFIEDLEYVIKPN